MSADDKYIKLQDAIDAGLDFVDFYCDNPDAQGAMIEHMESVPAADVKPVVRCRECKRWNTDNITGSFPDGVMCFCTELSGGLVRRYTAPDDFCCWGERKEEKEEAERG